MRNRRIHRSPCRIQTAQSPASPPDAAADSSASPIRAPRPHPPSPSPQSPPATPQSPHPSPLKSAPPGPQPRPGAPSMARLLAQWVGCTTPHAPPDHSYSTPPDRPRSSTARSSAETPTVASTTSSTTSASAIASCDFAIPIRSASSARLAQPRRIDQLHRDPLNRNPSPSPNPASSPEPPSQSPAPAPPAG